MPNSVVTAISESLRSFLPFSEPDYRSRTGSRQTNNTRRTTVRSANQLTRARVPASVSARDKSSSVGDKFYKNIYHLGKGAITGKEVLVPIPTHLKNLQYQRSLDRQKEERQRAAELRARHEEMRLRAKEEYEHQRQMQHKQDEQEAVELERQRRHAMRQEAKKAEREFEIEMERMRQKQRSESVGRSNRAAMTGNMMPGAGYGMQVPVPGPGVLGFGMPGWPAPMASLYPMAPPVMPCVPHVAAYANPAPPQMLHTPRPKSRDTSNSRSTSLPSSRNAHARQEAARVLANIQRGKPFTAGLRPNGTIYTVPASKARSVSARPPHSAQSPYYQSDADDSTE